MPTQHQERPGLIQHKVRPEVKQWIEAQAKAQERSQAWFVNKLVEDAFQRGQKQGAQQ